MSRARRAVAVTCTLAVAAGIGVAPPAHASVSATPDVTDRANGKVFALAHHGGTTYIGGEFTMAGGDTRTNLAAIGPDGQVTAFDPVVDGRVSALAVSEDGGTVFVGGTFTSAGGAERTSLAAIDATTGLALPGWQADAGGTYLDVLGLDLHGDRLYVAGRFTRLDDAPRRRLAAVDVTTGDVDAGFDPAANAPVRAVRVSPDGSTVWAGGSFTAIGGVPRPAKVAGLSASTGDATSFDAGVDGGTVVTVELATDGGMFFFSTENNTLFAYDVDADEAPAWTRKTSGDTQAIAASASGELYIGGHFSQDVTSKEKRSYFASITIADGALTPWAPQATGGQMGVWALLVADGHLHAGGVFQYFDGVLQRAYARFAGTP